MSFTAFLWYRGETQHFDALVPTEGLEYICPPKDIAKNIYRSVIVSTISSDTQIIV